MPTFTAVAKISRQRDGEGGKEKPAGRTSLSLGVIQSQVNVPGAKGKGYTHWPVHAYV